MKTNPNDPATASKVYEESGNDILGEVPVFKSGLTKREHFAALALQGIIAAQTPGIKMQIATDAVIYADELIMALNRTTNQKI